MRGQRNKQRKVKEVAGAVQFGNREERRRGGRMSVLRRR
jgi:hypothetical protein